MGFTFIKNDQKCRGPTVSGCESFWLFLLMAVVGKADSSWHPATHMVSASHTQPRLLEKSAVSWLHVTSWALHSHTFQVNIGGLILKNVSGGTSLYVKVLGGGQAPTPKVYRPPAFVDEWWEKLSIEYSQVFWTKSCWFEGTNFY